MQTKRLTLLTTPEFKAFLSSEAAREGVSVAQLVRSRCERKPTVEEAILASLADELQRAVREARISLDAGLTEADSVLQELRAQRAAAPVRSGVASHAARARARLPNTAAAEPDA